MEIYHHKLFVFMGPLSKVSGLPLQENNDILLSNSIETIHSTFNKRQFQKCSNMQLESI